VSVLRGGRILQAGLAEAVENTLDQFGFDEPSTRESEHADRLADAAMPGFAFTGGAGAGILDQRSTTGVQSGIGTQGGHQ
jgi:hypothetical protein